MLLRAQLLRRIVPVILLFHTYHILSIVAYMKSVRVDEIPFMELSKAEHKQIPNRAGIQAISRLEPHRSFFHLFNVPYIVCFFAAKGKWPLIPPMMQYRVDSVAKTVFSQNDSFIKQFCHKWIQIKECFRPVLPTKSEVEPLEPARATACTCANLESSANVPVVYFDKDHIGNVSAETILSTIEFLESFLPAPTKKPKRNKHRVRSRLDDMEIDGME